MSDDLDFSITPPPSKPTKMRFEDDFAYNVAFKLAFVGVGQAGGRIAETFRKLGSPLQGHPHRTPELGIDSCSGSLGTGLSTAQGMALAIKQAYLEATFRELPVDPKHDYDEGTKNDDEWLIAFKQFVSMNMEEDGATEAALAYYKSRVLPWHDIAELTDRVIKKTYRDMFSGDLF